MEQKETIATQTEETPVVDAKKTGLSTPVSILIAGVFVAGAILYSHFAPAIPVTQPTTTKQPVQAQAPSVDIKNVKTENAPYIGKADAPVTIAYWSDYQCPYCKQFETTTFAQIKSQYVDTGKVKVVFKDFAFLGQDSITAGLYERAIWELYPVQYWSWREAMYNAQDDEGDRGFGDEGSIKELTTTLSGIDVAKVAKAVADNKLRYQGMMDADKIEGNSFGVKGTPGVIIGTTLIPGAVDFSKISPLIDAELKK